MTSTNIARIFCSLFGVGFIPKAPGTFGSIGGLIIWYALSFYCVSFALSMIFVAVTLLGLWGTAKILAADDAGISDPQYIVIDEVVGVWIAAFTLTPQSSWMSWVAAFILFRFFDIKKPWLVSKAETLPGEFGVMADDLVAGFFSLIIVICLQILIGG